jgi:DNA end-binding protein Ku
MPKRTKKSHKSRRTRSRSASDAAPSGRPVWQGDLRLSLVSCPVALLSAASKAREISFHLLNAQTNNRIRMVPTDPETGPVARAELVKGYEISKNRYVILDDEDLEKMRLETTHAIAIERFVRAGDIDRLYWKDPYYLVPTEDPSPYIVIRQALADANRIALGRLVMHTRERVLALEARGNGITAYTLRSRDELVAPQTAFAAIPSSKPDRRMVEIARKIIEQQEGEFEPRMFIDRYEKALRDLIRRKQKGEKLVTAEPVPDSNIIDLMDALKQSLRRKSAGRHAARRRAK